MGLQVMAWWRQWYRRVHWQVVHQWKTCARDPIGCNHSFTSKGWSRVYDAIVRFKRTREMTSAVRIAPRSIPVISVGNFTFGATGKTPFVMFLTQWIQSELRATRSSHRGVKVPMLLTRGYGNDESKMFQSMFPDCVCAIGIDRVQLGRQTVANEPDRIACILLEDGLQQWRIQRDLEIVMVDALHPFGNGRLIPNGSLRELPRDALQRADVIVVHHANLLSSASRLERLLQQLEQIASPVRTPLITTSCVRVVQLRSIFQDESHAPHNHQDHMQLRKDCAALVFTGVGNPQSVRMVVSQWFAWSHLELECFPDHHQFSISELLELQQQAQRLGQIHDQVVVLTTEKDFFRCGPLMRQVFEQVDVRVIETRLEMDNLLHQTQLLQRITDLMNTAPSTTATSSQ